MLTNRTTFRGMNITDSVQFFSFASHVHSLFYFSFSPEHHVECGWMCAHDKEQFSSIPNKMAGVSQLLDILWCTYANAYSTKYPKKTTHTHIRYHTFTLIHSHQSPGISWENQSRAIEHPFRQYPCVFFFSRLKLISALTVKYTLHNAFCQFGKFHAQYQPGCPFLSHKSFEFRRVFRVLRVKNTQHPESISIQISVWYFMWLVSSRCIPLTSASNYYYQLVLSIYVITAFSIGIDGCIRATHSHTPHFYDCKIDFEHVIYINIYCSCDEWCVWCFDTAEYISERSINGPLAI